MFVQMIFLNGFEMEDTEEMNQMNQAARKFYIWAFGF